MALRSRCNYLALSLSLASSSKTSIAHNLINKSLDKSRWFFIFLFLQNPFSKVKKYRNIPYIKINRINLFCYLIFPKIYLKYVTLLITHWLIVYVQNYVHIFFFFHSNVSKILTHILFIISSNQQLII